MTFGDRLKQLRDGAGLSQSMLAAAAEIGLQTLKDYEGNRRGPSLEIAQRLAKALGETCLAFDGCEFRHATQGPKKDAADEAPAEPRRPRGRPKKVPAVDQAAEPAPAKP